MEMDENAGFTGNLVITPIEDLTPPVISKAIDNLDRNS
ncbi:hypothetical protein LEP1GSC173_4123 [Leptospira interrogans str. HAI1594]|uniref:Uncharacterized protein n=4 Tax=Leptospira interrogans TaxID=173 RepID=M3HYP9_LEPIR|nr:hypothetical protein LEP1GSC117_1237 [Leptospira interrogans serovar Icterohaemorrhagiae str. Verdun LP]EKP74444.1 hypothetical protein LEP1GSC173_4123 [Leptospira interrogans str. HAI1594]EKR45549.1 hypothetical protein LEP1GSC097_4434 [Leptospira interrogans serovar Grippotyphosa str. UI 08368]EMF40586.1 hypothetical protein LEP1GSC067_0078 [Leptospira interrogans serovar Lora str. TE 1992]EMG08371.1 hypothetical protein LEP1GSC151_4712 [Leptospira interrogans serovar Grippotyphosa str. LT